MSTKDQIRSAEEEAAAAQFNRDHAATKPSENQESQGDTKEAATSLDMNADSQNIFNLDEGAIESLNLPVVDFKDHFGQGESWKDIKSGDLVKKKKDDERYTVYVVDAPPSPFNPDGKVRPLFTTEPSPDGPDIKKRFGYKRSEDGQYGLNHIKAETLSKMGKSGGLETLKAEWKVAEGQPNENGTRPHEEVYKDFNGSERIIETTTRKDGTLATYVMKETGAKLGKDTLFGNVRNGETRVTQFSSSPQDMYGGGMLSVSGGGTLEQPKYIKDTKKLYKGLQGDQPKFTHPKF